MTSDEHFGHENILKYCNRPFNSVAEMNHEMIERNNSVVTDNDIVIHCGDFTLNKEQYALDIIEQLKGNHIFLTGSHDKWMKKFDWNSFVTSFDGKFLNDGITFIPRVSRGGYVFEQNIDGTYIVACHYAMRVWPRSHHGSIHVYGHSHGNLPSLGKSMDVGVDCNNFYPISLKQVIERINHENEKS